MVVIGGGMTAIDAGGAGEELGAEEVTIVYRRGREQMSASAYEQELAATPACASSPAPRRSAGGNGAAGVAFAYTADGARRARPSPLPPTRC